MTKYKISFIKYIIVNTENEDDAILEAYEKFNDDPNKYMEIEEE